MLVDVLPMHAGGVDPLGLRQLNFNLMDDLIPGLNNVASRLRVYVLLAWAWWKAVELGKTEGKSQQSADRLRAYPFALASELEDAAKEHGYRIPTGSADGWQFWKSATARGELAVAAASSSGPFFLSVEHSGVGLEHGAPPAAPPAKDHAAAFVFPSRDALCAGVSRAYQLGISLPTVPLEQFEREAATLGATEAEAIARRRIGQDVFRAALVEYHSGRCQVTGIADAALLRASHIIPWSKCQSDAERLDVHNGLLLSSLWDAAFDQGLVSFDDAGAPLFSAALSADARALLENGVTRGLDLRPEHRSRLAWHRDHLFQS